MFLNSYECNFYVYFLITWVQVTQDKIKVKFKLDLEHLEVQNFSFFLPYNKLFKHPNSQNMKYFCKT